MKWKLFIIRKVGICCLVIWLLFEISNNKKKVMPQLVYFISFQKGYFLIYIYWLLNSFHYQGTLKICPPYLLERQKMVHENPHCLKQRSICWKASSMLAEFSVSEKGSLLWVTLPWAVDTFGCRKKKEFQGAVKRAGLLCL